MKNSQKQFRVLILALISFLAWPLSSASASTCSAIISRLSSQQPKVALGQPVIAIPQFSHPVRETLMDYDRLAQQDSAGVVKPGFSSPKDEIASARTWNGVKGPDTLQKMLPDDVMFIDHQLHGANGDGLVKTNSGNMVHLRGFVGKIGTNFGVVLQALKDNLHRSNKTFVRENADAVVIFIHGGGTKTTGHHVAASMMSYMSTRNYDVVSLDLPWHGEGPRVSFESVKDSMELTRQFIQKYVAPAGKPIILSGHSMGGIIADLYMRMYPNDTLVKAVVSLSPPADSMPGGTFSQKFARDAEIALKNLTNPKIPEAERDLGVWLARQNKLSPTCGMFCQVLYYAIDWTLPAHQGKDYLPALYVIGEADGLYQGYEKSFSSGVDALANATLKVIGLRRDIKDKTGKNMVPIGHLIFDHKPLIEFAADVPESVKLSLYNGTFMKAEHEALKSSKQTELDLVSFQKAAFDNLRAEGKLKVEEGVEFEDLATPETFVLVRNFISKIVGKPATRTKLELTPIEVATQAYANNLYFRQFAKRFVYMYLRPTEKGAQLGSSLEAVTKQLKSLTSQMAGKTATPEQLAQQAKLQAYKQEVEAIMKTKGKVSEADLPAYKQIKAQYDAINSTELNAVNQKRKILRQEMTDLKSASLIAEKIVLSYSKIVSSPNLDQISNAVERAFRLMMLQDAKVRSLTESYLSSSPYVNGAIKFKSIEDLPPEIVLEFKKFEQLSNLYQRILIRFESSIVSEAQAGSINLTGPKTTLGTDSNLQELIDKANLIRENSAKLKTVVTQLEAAEKEFAAISEKLFNLESALAGFAGREYFVPEYYTVEQLLSNSANQKLSQEQISSLLQKIWAEWQKIWSTRIGESSESLY